MEQLIENLLLGKFNNLNHLFLPPICFTNYILCKVYQFSGTTNSVDSKYTRVLSLKIVVAFKRILKFVVRASVQALFQVGHNNPEFYNLKYEVKNKILNNCLFCVNIGIFIVVVTRLKFEYKTPDIKRT